MTENDINFSTKTQSDVEEEVGGVSGDGDEVVVQSISVQNEIENEFEDDGNEIESLIHPNTLSIKSSSTLSTPTTATTTKKERQSFIPIIISKCDSDRGSNSAGGSQRSLQDQNDEDQNERKYQKMSKPLLEVDSNQLTISSLRSLGLVDTDTNGNTDSGRIPAWNAFALSDPNAQMTVKSITSVGVGSTDGRNLYVRRVPSTASILIGNTIAMRRETEGDSEMSDDWSGSLGSLEAGTRRPNWRSKLEFIFASFGFTLGLGNLWRFPYLCYSSGGGAFLIPYSITFFVCAIPLLYLELAIGQFLRRGPLRAFEKICPLFKGIGAASLIISFIMSTYIIVILSWTIYYLVASFNAQLPWTGCTNDWNTDNCWSSLQNTSSSNSSDGNALNNQTTSKNFLLPSTPAGTRNISASISAQEFFDHKVLQKSAGIGEPGYLRNELILCLFFGWILVYFSLWKIRSSGKVVYLTAIFPYILLIAFISFALTLPGANQGLQYFFRPQWNSLWDPKVWVNSIAQNFNSLGLATGSMITFSSYNKFSNNILTDTLAIGFTSLFTSFLVGIIIFSVLGNIALEGSKAIDDVISDGPGLVFVVYPQILAKMPFSHFWSVLFFSMLLCVALNNQFALVEVVLTSFRDGFPKLIEKYLKCHELLVFVVCTICALTGLPFVLQGGIYGFQLIDFYVAGYSLMYIAFFEMTILVWIYGVDRLCNNILEMTGNRTSSYFTFCWYAAPALLLSVWVLGFIDYRRPTYDNGRVPYPQWSEILAWVISSIPLICIATFAFIQIQKSTGATILEKLKSSMQSSVYECPICKCTRSCTHDADDKGSEWNLRRRSSIKTTKLTPVIMSEAVYDKVSSL